MRKADNLPPSCAVVMKSGNLNFLEPSGHLGPVMGLLYLYKYIYVCVYLLVQIINKKRLRQQLTEQVGVEAAP